MKKSLGKILGEMFREGELDMLVAETVGEIIEKNAEFRQDYVWKSLFYFIPHFKDPEAKEYLARIAVKYNNPLSN